MRRAVVACLALLALPSAVLAQGKEEGTPSSGAGSAEPPRQWVNLRLGGSTGNKSGRPEVCAEASPFGPFSLEACGTGNGVWHDDPNPELSHYRANVRLYTFRMGAGFLQPRVGAGIAELQLAPDDAGLAFGGTGRRRIETAGADAGGSLQMLIPLRYGFELVANATFGAAYLPHAGELAVPQQKFQPYLGIGVGVGF